MKNYTWYKVRLLTAGGRPLKSETCYSETTARELARKWDTGDTVLVIITPLYK